MKGSARTYRVSEFLNANNPDEMNFYADAERAIWGHQNFNPREIYKLKKHFVLNSCYEDLCELVNEGEPLELLNKKITFQLGKKGSGKTISQNVWLGDKNEILENNKVFLVRLDVEKLHNLRERMSKELEGEPSLNRVPFKCCIFTDMNKFSLILAFALTLFTNAFAQETTPILDLEPIPTLDMNEIGYFDKSKYKKNTLPSCNIACINGELTLNCFGAESSTFGQKRNEHDEIAIKSCGKPVKYQKIRTVQRK
ncbi:MAG: hypothetical protein FWC15_05205 [Fibromonadales bacterium]|nr:hypothetical protein [Fibromonadales bacterium]